MIEKRTVERLMRAHARVARILGAQPGLLFRDTTRRRRARSAARVLCDELGALLSEEGYWNGLASATESLVRDPELERRLMRNTALLIEQEKLVFSRLELDEVKSDAVIEDVMAALVWREQVPEPNPVSIRNLRNRLKEAHDLVCRAARGPIARTVDRVAGRKGLRILAGGALGGANVAAALLIDGSVLSWVSLKAGYRVMSGDVDGVIDLLKESLEDGGA